MPASAPPMTPADIAQEIARLERFADRQIIEPKLATLAREVAEQLRDTPCAVTKRTAWDADKGAMIAAIIDLANDKHALETKLTIIANFRALNQSLRVLKELIVGKRFALIDALRHENGTYDSYRDANYRWFVRFGADGEQYPISGAGLAKLRERFRSFAAIDKIPRTELLAKQYAQLDENALGCAIALVRNENPNDLIEAAMRHYTHYAKVRTWLFRQKSIMEIASNSATEKKYKSEMKLTECLLRDAGLDRLIDPQDLARKICDQKKERGCYDPHTYSWGLPLIPVEEDNGNA